MPGALVAAWLALAGVVTAAWPRVATLRASRGWILVLALVFALVLQLVVATVPDDAFVTFRYARNMAEGYGAVYTIGERTQGLPNFLWLVLVTLPGALFGADVVTGAVVLGIACALGCVVVAYLLAKRCTTTTGVLAALLTAGASLLAAHGLAGTETPLFVLLVLAGCLALVTGHPLVAGVLAALAVMTRSDGVVFALLGEVWLLTAAVRRRSSWWGPAGYLLGALVFLVPWWAWEATYYGHARSGWPASSHLPYGFLLCALAAVGAAVASGRTSNRPSPRPRRRLAERRVVPAVALVLCAVSVPAAFAAQQVVHVDRQRMAQTTEIGHWLRDRLPSGSNIDTFGNAALAYRAGSRMMITGVTGSARDDEYAPVALFGLPVLAAPLAWYSPAQDCGIAEKYAQRYEVATFQRTGLGWLTLYLRADSESRLLSQLSGDERLTYVPCP
ncbi:ArnT family glycosyltransferase [Amycolatopsis tucumanensis]|uniref:ArnT family glycosyltransferase n=1 Tax=Amycolatopsis tucumanensis TaxID=401106 RepID=UPI003D70D2A9